MRTQKRPGTNIRDTWTMVKRPMRHALRSKDTIMTAVITPILMMLFFVNIFGGSINTGPVKYVDFVVPGIVLMSGALGAAYGAMRLNDDLTKGIVSRFRSMPIARSSFLTGHVITSVLFNMLSAAAVLGAAFLTGFRTDANLVVWLVLGGLLLLVTTALSWMSTIFGLIAKGPEGASAFCYLLLLLVFVSSAFVPTESMNPAVRAFAEHQPMTPIIETTRALLTQGTVGPSGGMALLWSAAVLVVSCIVALRIYSAKAA
jgi:ABC-2 type transport system permease protein